MTSLPFAYFEGGMITGEVERKYVDCLGVFAPCSPRDGVIGLLSLSSRD